MIQWTPHRMARADSLTDNSNRKEPICPKITPAPIFCPPSHTWRRHGNVRTRVSPAAGRGRAFPVCPACSRPRNTGALRYQRISFCPQSAKVQRLRRIRLETDLPDLSSLYGLFLIAAFVMTNWFPSARFMFWRTDWSWLCKLGTYYTGGAFYACISKNTLRKICRADAAVIMIIAAFLFWFAWPLWLTVLCTRSMRNCFLGLLYNLSIKR